jgi:hypothetical protein
VLDAQAVVGIVDDRDAFADELLVLGAGLDEIQHLIVLQSERLRDRALLLPGEDVIQPLVPQQGRCTSCGRYAGLANRKL